MVTIAEDDVDALRQQLADARRSAESLRRVIEAISGELALEPLLTRIVESAVKLIGAGYGTIGLVVDTPGGIVVRTAAAYNMPPHELGAEMPPGVGLAGRVLQERRPICLQRYGDLDCPTLPELAEHTVVGVPIWWADQMIGFFGIGAEPPRCFGKRDNEALSLFARHAAIAIQNARRYEWERRRTERLALIARIGRIITADLLLDELLQTAADAIHELLGYPNIAIPLIDPEDPATLVLRTVGGHYRASVRGEYRLPITGGIMGAAARMRRVELVNDVASDPRYIPIPGVVGIRAELAVPILLGERVLGVLNVESGDPLTEEDAASLQIIADQLAVAIGNAQLFAIEQRRVNRIATINRIARLLTSSLSLDQLLQTAVAAIGDELPYHNIALLLIDPDDPSTLVLRARSGIYTQNVIGEYRQSIERGVIGAAARTYQRVLVNDVWSDPRYIPIPGADIIRSELALPLVVGERLLGVLNVESTRLIPEEDATDLEIVADQLGIAIENASRYREEQQRSERLALIARVGQRIATRLDPDELFTTTVEELHGRLGYDHVSLFLLDPDDSAWLVQHARASRWPRGESVGYRQAVGRGIIGAAAQQRTPVLVNDITADPRYIPVPRADELRAELAVPLLLDDRLLGVIDVAGRRRFRTEDVTGIQIIADQIAIAVDHARLFVDKQRTLDETQLLYETSQRISTAMGIDEVIAAYLEHVAVRGRYACSVGLYEFDEGGERTAVLVHGRWSFEDGLVLEQVRHAYTRDALDPPLDAGQTVTIADVHSDPRVSDELRRIQSESQRPALAMIPLIARGRRIGLVVLSYPAVHEWPAAELRPYQVTAAQLATAIDNRRQQVLLYERGRQLAVFEERQRLARDLHDSVTQLLFSTALIAQSLVPAWRRDPAEGERRVNRLLELSQSALSEMRALLAELRPPEPDTEAKDSRAMPGLQKVERAGLAEALRSYIAAVAQDGLHVELDLQGYVRQSSEKEEALYRIAQEALNNVVKHAHARSVTVRLVSDDRAIHLRIKDDGKGCVLGQAKNLPAHAGQGGFGLRTMRERAEALGGTFHIVAVPAGGTYVEVRLPVVRKKEL